MSNQGPPPWEGQQGGYERQTQQGDRVPQAQPGWDGAGPTAPGGDQAQTGWSHAQQPGGSQTQPGWNQAQQPGWSQAPPGWGQPGYAPQGYPPPGYGGPGYPQQPPSNNTALKVAIPVIVTLAVVGLVLGLVFGLSGGSSNHSATHPGPTSHARHRDSGSSGSGSGASGSGSGNSRTSDSGDSGSGSPSTSTPGNSGTAGAPSMADVNFIETTNAAPALAAIPAPTRISTAHGVCSAMQQGANFTQATQGAASTLKVTPAIAQVLAGAAVAAYCSQYTNQISG